VAPAERPRREGGAVTDLVPTKNAVNVLRTLCGRNVHAGRIDGTIRTKTLQEEFVIFDFNKKPKTRCENSVDIPRADVVGIQEDPPVR
jgi:hypothetical protein